jgi:hypothetical protein
MYIIIWKISTSWERVQISSLKTMLYLFLKLVYINDIFSDNIYIKTQLKPPILRRLSWTWSYASWIYNYLCNQCLSSLMLWVRISIRVRCTTLCDKVCQWLATGRWFSSGPSVSSTNKTDSHDLTEILLKVALNTIKQTKQTNILSWGFLFILITHYI